MKTEFDGVGEHSLEDLGLRQECPEDRESIYALTLEAFKTMPYSGGYEQDLIDELRNESALTLSLVAELGDRVVGHVAFSPASSRPGFGSWCSLGPVSVLPIYQRKGIGAKLIRKGLADLKELGYRGCILVGNPNYYRKFGFELFPNLAPSQQPKEFFMMKSFDGSDPTEPVDFHPCFYAPRSTHKKVGNE